MVTENSSSTPDGVTKQELSAVGISEQSARFFRLISEMWAMHKKKAAGYGKQEDTWANFRGSSNYGVKPLHGVLVRMNDKVVRIQNIVRDPNNEQLGESLRDNLMDLASYALIAICLMEEEDGQ